MTSIVLGSIPFPNQSGDRIVSKAISAAIAALFKRTEKLEANVRAEPVAKILQGSVDGFDFVGAGMLMYNGLRLKAMELSVEAVSIDIGAIFQGQVKLRQPTQSRMRVVLSQEDLTTSFNTPFVVEKLQRVKYQDKPLHFEDTEMTLNDDKSVSVRSQVRLGETAESVSVDITAHLQVEDRHRIQFVDATYNGTPEAVELGKTLIGHVNSLLDLDKFALEGTQLRVDQMRLQRQQLIFYGTAQIDQFPQRRSGVAAG